MYCSEDFERFFIRYKGGYPKGESIQQSSREMVQGYRAQGRGGESLRPSLHQEDEKANETVTQQKEETVRDGSFSGELAPRPTTLSCIPVGFRSIQLWNTSRSSLQR